MRFLAGQVTSVSLLAVACVTIIKEPQVATVSTEAAPASAPSSHAALREVVRVSTHLRDEVSDLSQATPLLTETQVLCDYAADAHVFDGNHSGGCSDATGQSHMDASSVALAVMVRRLASSWNLFMSVDAWYFVVILLDLGLAFCYFSVMAFCEHALVSCVSLFVRHLRKLAQPWGLGHTATSANVGGTAQQRIVANDRDDNPPLWQTPPAPPPPPLPNPLAAGPPPQPRQPQQLPLLPTLPEPRPSRQSPEFPPLEPLPPQVGPRQLHERDGEGGELRRRERRLEDVRPAQSPLQPKRLSWLRTLSPAAAAATTSPGPARNELPIAAVNLGDLPHHIQRLALENSDLEDLLVETDGRAFGTAASSASSTGSASASLLQRRRGHGRDRSAAALLPPPRRPVVERPPHGELQDLCSEIFRANWALGRHLEQAAVGTGPLPPWGGDGNAASLPTPPVQPPLPHRGGAVALMSAAPCEQVATVVTATTTGGRACEGGNASVGGGSNTGVGLGSSKSCSSSSRIFEDGEEYNRLLHFLDQEEPNSCESVSIDSPRNFTSCASNLLSSEPLRKAGAAPSTSVPVLGNITNVLTADSFR